jgi:hypothetical protein
LFSAADDADEEPEIEEQQPEPLAASAEEDEEEELILPTQQSPVKTKRGRPRKAGASKIEEMPERETDSQETEVDNAEEDEADKPKRSGRQQNKKGQMTLDTPEKGKEQKDKRQRRLEVETDKPETDTQETEVDAAEEDEADKVKKSGRQQSKKRQLTLDTPQKGRQQKDKKQRRSETEADTAEEDEMDKPEMGKRSRKPKGFDSDVWSTPTPSRRVPATPKRNSEKENENEGSPNSANLSVSSSSKQENDKSLNSPRTEVGLRQAATPTRSRQGRGERSYVTLTPARGRRTQEVNPENTTLQNDDSEVVVSPAHKRTRQSRTSVGSPLSLTPTQVRSRKNEVQSEDDGDDTNLPPIVSPPPHSSKRLSPRNKEVSSPQPGPSKGRTQPRFTIPGIE